MRDADSPKPGLPRRRRLDLVAVVSRLSQALDADEVVDIAAELIRRPSPNPPGDEREVAAFVVDRVRGLHCHAVEIREPAPGRKSVLGRWGTPGGRVLAWNGHLDVVPAGDLRAWSSPPYEPRVDVGRLWGRGAADMKGSVACALAALTTIARAGLQLQGEVLLMIAADEETGSEYGTLPLVLEGAVQGVDAAICGEATELDLYLAAKGLTWLEITVRGRSCHASQPHLGANAITGMAHVLMTLERWTPSTSHARLGQPTVTPTIIEGGTKENIVPDACRLRVDRRVVPGEDRRLVLAEVEAMLSGVPALTGLEVDVRELTSWEPSEIDAQAPIVEAMKSAVHAATGRMPELGGTSGSTDARHLINSGGIPTVIFGPGRMDQAHTADEWIAVDQLRLGVLALAATFCEFLGAVPATGAGGRSVTGA